MSITADLLRDLETLGDHALRVKYASEANSHANMKRRCNDGRFSYDPAWDRFRDFLRDMGPRPSLAHTLDRIASQLPNYGPGLCRWADKREQTQNRSNTRFVEVTGQQLTLQEFADHVGAPYKTIHSALARGESVESILQRYKARGGGYCPPRYVDRPEAFDDWLKRYGAWRARLQRDRQHLAPLEVFDITGVSEAFLTASSWLVDQGFDQLTEDEDEAANTLLQSLQGQIWQEAPAWLEAGLDALRSRDPALAKRILDHGKDWRSFARFKTWLEKPAPPPASSARTRTDADWSPWD